MDTDHFRVRLELFREKAQVMIQLLEGCRICDAFCSRLRDISIVGQRDLPFLFTTSHASRFHVSIELPISQLSSSPLWDGRQVGWRTGRCG